MRELKNTLQRTIIFHQPTCIQPDDLELRGQYQLDSSSRSAESEVVTASKREATAKFAESLPQAAADLIEGNTSAVPFVLPAAGISLEDLEKSVLVQALERARFNQTKAAQLLGISRHTLRYRLEKFGLVEAPA